ncbi:hypothetical protein ScalyP_jg696, partial [Parmales sp. scaly parma]
THYIRSAEMGAQATMSSTVNEAFYSSHNDQSIKVELGVSWNGFGGGGSASTSKTHSEEYSSSGSTSTIQVNGGDPSLAQWPITGELSDWQDWVDSVKTVSPSVVQYYVDSHSFLVEDAEKSAYLDSAVNDYLVKNNYVWPDADPTSYTLGWCDCQWVNHADFPSAVPLGCSDHNGEGNKGCFVVGCSSLGDGYFMKDMMQIVKTDHDHGEYMVGTADGKYDYQWGHKGVECCKACYK